MKMQQNVTFYDIGPATKGVVNTPYYNMELGRTMMYSNVVRTTQVIIQIRKYIKLGYTIINRRL